MTDDITLIEKIARNQAETAKDLKLLKSKESEFAEDIEAIAQHQQCGIEAVEWLKAKMQKDAKCLHDWSDITPTGFRICRFCDAKLKEKESK